MPSNTPTAPPPTSSSSASYPLMLKLMKPVQVKYASVHVVKVLLCLTLIVHQALVGLGIEQLAVHLYDEHFRHENRTEVKEVLKLDTSILSLVLLVDTLLNLIHFIIIILALFTTNVVVFFLKLLSIATVTLLTILVHTHKGPLGHGTLPSDWFVYLMSGGVIGSSLILLLLLNLPFLILLHGRRKYRDYLDHQERVMRGLGDGPPAQSGSGSVARRESYGSPQQHSHNTPPPYPGWQEVEVGGYQPRPLPQPEPVPAAATPPHGMPRAVYATGVRVLH